MEMVKVVLNLDEQNDQFEVKGISLFGKKINNKKVGVALDRVYTALNKGEVNPDLYEGL